MLVGFILFMVVAVSAQSTRAVQTCVRVADDSTLGWCLRIKVPTDAIVKRVKDVDHSRYSLAFGSEHRAKLLEGFTGLNVGDDRIPREWLKASVKVWRRRWRRNEFKGIDAKGWLRNGNYWRYVGTSGENVSYYDAPTGAASYFDRLLDSVCWVDPK
jgi:hypothetical protein